MWSRPYEEFYVELPTRSENYMHTRDYLDWATFDSLFDYLQKRKMRLDCQIFCGNTRPMTLQLYTRIIIIKLLYGQNDLPLRNAGMTSAPDIQKMLIMLQRPSGEAEKIWYFLARIYYQKFFLIYELVEKEWMILQFVSLQQYCDVWNARIPATSVRLIMMYNVH